MNTRQQNQTLEDTVRMPRELSIPNLNLQFIKPLKIWRFGPESDAVVEMVSSVAGGGLIESGIYYGDGKNKDIIKVSSQVGCPAKCTFCEVGDEKFSRNLTTMEIVEQFNLMLAVLKGQKRTDSIDGVKINFAGTGEPLYNQKILPAIEELGKLVNVIKISTILPRTKTLVVMMEKIAKFSALNNFPIQIQLSLISTDQDFRSKTIGVPVYDFKEIADLACYWRSFGPIRKQFNLSLIIGEDTPVSVAEVKDIFPPEHFRFRFRPYVPTSNGTKNGEKILSQVRYQSIVDSFQKYGYLGGLEAMPTKTEWEYNLASNVTRRNYASDIRPPTFL